MKKRCIVNVAVGGIFQGRGVHNLSRSLDVVKEPAKKIFYTGVWPPNSPTHKEVPYAFKPIAIDEARKQGYEVILWCDASITALKPLDKVWEKIEEQGHLFFMNGWNTGNWTADTALEPLGITREESFEIPHICACCMGLDLTHSVTRSFLDEWVRLAKEGTAFKGAWHNNVNQVSKHPDVLGHRHDQTVASVLLHKLKMNIETYPTFFSYPPVKDESVCLLAKGA
jgi:hypothetical protein